MRRPYKKGYKPIHNVHEELRASTLMSNTKLKVQSKNLLKITYQHFVRCRLRQCRQNHKKNIKKHKQ